MFYVSIVWSQNLICLYFSVFVYKTLMVFLNLKYKYFYVYFLKVDIFMFISLYLQSDQFKCFFFRAINFISSLHLFLCVASWPILFVCKHFFFMLAINKTHSHFWNFFVCGWHFAFPNNLIFGWYYLLYSSFQFHLISHRSWKKHVNQTLKN